MVKQIIKKLHLWLGLLSGIPIFIVCITGCLYVFKDEINSITQPWKYVTPTGELLQPSTIINIANKIAQNEKPTAITFGETNKAVKVDYYQPSATKTVYINPYTGNYVKTTLRQKGNYDFFRFVIQGHKSLWLPRKIGKPIIGYSTLIFAIVLITGLVLWFPKNKTKKVFKQRLTLKLKLHVKRLTYDLHNVLGFYAFLILLILSLSGLIRSFNWFSDSVYFLTSGGKTRQAYTLPKSDTYLTQTTSIDTLYNNIKSQNQYAKSLYFSLPSQADDVYRVSVVHTKNSYYKTDNLFFDQYSLQPLQGTGLYAGKYTHASGADKLLRMNLDIHTGKIFGLFGKILVFICSLIGASLPVTGFLIFLNRIRNKLQRT